MDAMGSGLFGFRKYGYFVVDLYNEHRAHAGICGKTPGDSGVTVCANLQFYRWREHCHALFQTPMAA
jgi:hypothetical protein